LFRSSLIQPPPSVALPKTKPPPDRSGLEAAFPQRKHWRCSRSSQLLTPQNLRDFGHWTLAPDVMLMLLPPLSKFIVFGTIVTAGHEALWDFRFGVFWDLGFCKLAQLMQTLPQ
jgi:hypothetical protein